MPPKGVYNTYEEQVQSRIDIRDGHWFWTGHLNRKGYGIVNYERRRRMASRVVYEHVVGPIPDGYEMDHVAGICSYKNCVRPGCVEPVTPAENSRRFWQGERERAAASIKKRSGKNHWMNR
jgi:hypothetical protein